MFKSCKFIQDVIGSCRFVLAVSGLGDEKATLQIAYYLKEIRKEGTKTISLVGGAASGKSTLARRIANTLENATVISTDDFVLGSRDYRRKYFEGEDPLQKYDFDLLREKVNRIRNLQPNESESVPVYDEKSGTAIKITALDPETGQILSIDTNNYQRRIGRVEYLIVEGDFQPLMAPDFQIFYHVPDEARLQNRIDRDTKQRSSKSVKEIIASFELRQEMQHRPYTLPCANNADLLIMVNVVLTNIGYKYEYTFWVSSNIARKFNRMLWRPVS